MASDDTSREAGKPSVEAPPIADQNQNPADAALAALVSALIAKGDRAAAMRMLAAYEGPKAEVGAAPVLALVPSAKKA